MILIVSNADDEHVAPVGHELRRRKHPFTVVDPGHFPASLTITSESRAGRSASTVERAGRALGLDEVDAVWYRRPRDFELSEDLEHGERVWLENECTHFIRSLWANMDSRLVNDPAAIRSANRKLVQLELAARLGLSVPDWIVTNDPSRATEFCRRQEAGTVVKALANPVLTTSQGPGMIYTHRLSAADHDVLDSVRFGPTFLQAFVSKSADVRVSVFGDRVFAVEIGSAVVEAAANDFRRVHPFELEHSAIELPAEIERACARIVAELGLSFGAIDLLATADGDHVFLEINPNGQWYWLEQLTGLPMTAALCDLLMGEGVPRSQPEPGDARGVRTLEIGTHVLPVPADLAAASAGATAVQLAATNVTIMRDGGGLAVQVGDVGAVRASSGASEDAE